MYKRKSPNNLRWVKIALRDRMVYYYCISIYLHMYITYISVLLLFCNHLTALSTLIRISNDISDNDYR